MSVVQGRRENRGGAVYRLYCFCPAHDGCSPGSCLPGARAAVFTQPVVAQDVGGRRDQGSREGSEGRSVCFEGEQADRQAGPVGQQFIRAAAKCCVSLECLSLSEVCRPSLKTQKM